MCAFHCTEEEVKQPASRNGTEWLCLVWKTDDAKGKMLKNVSLALFYLVNFMKMFSSCYIEVVGFLERGTNLRKSMKP